MDQCLRRGGRLEREIEVLGLRADRVELLEKLLLASELHNDTGGGGSSSNSSISKSSISSSISSSSSSSSNDMPTCSQAPTTASESTVPAADICVSTYSHQEAAIKRIAGVIADRTGD